MKTLAIFGDSYARSDATDIQEKSWHEFMDGYHITNFGDPGSCLWYSYDLFLQNHSKFDKIIFLVTSPNRITLTGPTVIYRNQNYKTAKIKIELTTGKELEQYKTVRDYYELIHDVRKDAVTHQLMVSDIKQIRLDAVVYPCFDNTWSHESPLYNITKFEDQYLGMTPEMRRELYRKGLRDSRACHMIEENNKVVAKMFLSKLSGVDNTLGQLIPPTKDVNYYYQSLWH